MYNISRGLNFLLSNLKELKFLVLNPWIESSISKWAEGWISNFQIILTYNWKIRHLKYKKNKLIWLKSKCEENMENSLFFLFWLKRSANNISLALECQEMFCKLNARIRRADRTLNQAIYDLVCAVCSARSYFTFFHTIF